jgi:hypothetical protein
MATKDYSIKQEKMIADYLGWDCVVASGARPCHPGDVASDYWLGECKTHVKPNSKIAFVFREWQKICEEAMSKGKFAVLFVDDGSQQASTTWCMIEANVAPLKFAPLPTHSHIDTSSLHLTSDCIASCDSSELHALKFEFNHRRVLVMRLEEFKSIC